MLLNIWKAKKLKPDDNKYMIVDASMIEEIVQKCNDNPGLKVTYHTLEGNTIEFVTTTNSNKRHGIMWETGE